MREAREERVQELLSSIKAVAMGLHSVHHFADDALMELSMAQFRTLMLLGKANAMTIGQVAQELGVGQSTAGHLVDRLVKAGFAQRSEDTEDRRRTVAYLSPAGQTIFMRFVGNTEAIRRYLHELSDEDLNALCQGFNALWSVINEKQYQPAPQGGDKG